MPVYLREDVWYIRLSIKGKRYHRAVPEASSKKDADKAEAIFKAELLQGKYNLADNKGCMLFTKLVDHYIDYTKTNNLSWKGCVSRAERIREYFGNKKLSDISPILIEKYRSDRKKTKKKEADLENECTYITNTTVNREVEILRKMFNIAIDNEWIDENPCSSRKVKKLREENKKERFLQPDEEKRLLAQCIGEFEYMKPIIICALNTGMRKGELLGLKWNCVDFKKGFITLLLTKSGKVRKIPISSALMPELNKLNQNKISEYVFANPDSGTRYFDLKRPFPSLCKNAKIKDLRFHDLRHTSATRMVASGIDLIVVQDILGHADIHTTMRYAHPVPERKLLAVEALANFSKKKKKVISIAR